MVKHRSYRDLEIYREAHAMGVEIHKLSLRLPSYELHETGSQLRRSSKSVSANIVEGYGRRRYKGEFIRFLVFAHSSCNESIEWMEYIRDCHPQFKQPAMSLLSRQEILSRKINRFIQAVEDSHKP